MALNIEKVITDKAEETHKAFRALIDKTNKEHPHPKDVKALSDLLDGNRKFELWRNVAMEATNGAIVCSRSLIVVAEFNSNSFSALSDRGESVSQRSIF